MARRSPRGPATSDPAPLSKLVFEVYPKDVPEEHVVQRLSVGWAAVVSERIGSNAWPVHFRAGVLTVHTSTASWANALSLEASQLIVRLRARTPGIALKRLVFRAGKLPEVPARVRREPPPPEVIPLAVLPEEGARAIARIPSDALRERVARAMASALGERVPRKKKDPR